MQLLYSDLLITLKIFSVTGIFIMIDNQITFDTLLKPFILPDFPVLMHNIKKFRDDNNVIIHKGKSHQHHDPIIGNAIADLSAKEALPFNYSIPHDQTPWLTCDFVIFAHKHLWCYVHSWDALDREDCFYCNRSLRTQIKLFSLCAQCSADIDLASVIVLSIGW